MSVNFYKVNDYVFHFGDRGKAFYIILKGSVSVQLPQNDEENPLSEVRVMKTGDAFGELALINDSRRSASVMALEPTVLGVLEGSFYKKILQNSDEEKLLDKVNFLRNFHMFKTWTGK